MKTTILFLSLAFLLCTFKAAPAPTPVTDIDGNLVHTGGEYYIWMDRAGSFLPAVVNNKSCLGGVVKYPDYGWGQPVIITPVNPKKSVIRVSTDVNIKFWDETSICDKSNVWKVEYDKAMKQYVVMLAGVEGNPGPKTLDNWFKIEKSGNGYKFVYCPSVCSTCKVMCRDVGTAIDGNGVTRLVLGGDPFSINFYLNDE
ncbi:hypothetical protein QVD17_04504 [Tagetes erecta]|uniref:Uncharacterized protein n=1 Tax=Tagetes erecta TaxID=13708 RepID=A0AAD8PAG6_TARER|nr:hypothetical protein QVD17_04504 [Tagetes erecta]